MKNVYIEMIDMLSKYRYDWCPLYQYLKMTLVKWLKISAHLFTYDSLLMGMSVCVTSMCMGVYNI